MEYKTQFGTYNVWMKKVNYSNGNLGIQLYDDGGPVATLTTNFKEKLPEGYAYVDTNNCPFAIDFIRENNLGRFTGEYHISRFCSYPLYNFNPKKETKKTGPTIR